MTGKDSFSGHPLLDLGDNAEAGSSGHPPPPFEASEGDAIVEFKDVASTLPEGGEEPPEFSPYEAEHRESSGGKVISHDPHLNEDGA